MNELLDRARLRDALEDLARELERRRVRADVYVFGGAAMILAYGADRATRDVDAKFAPHGPVLEAAHTVAERRGLPPSWLDDQATVFLSRQSDDAGPAVFDHPYLRVQSASAEHLLAMKARACRDRDLDDIVILASHLGLRTADEVVAVAREVFPDNPLAEHKRLRIEDALRQV